jgi:hypothetical protein
MDIWEATDALRMLRETGADGVVIGRGCLGRPWLFADLAEAFAAVGADSAGSGRAVPSGHGGPRLLSLGQVAVTLRRHAELLAALMGEQHGLTDLRKHMAWYFKGFPVGGELRQRLGTVSTLDELDGLLGRLDPEVAFPVAELGQPRGRQGAPRERVALPEGWFDGTSGRPRSRGAELGVSGGDEVSARAQAWAATMSGHASGGLVRAHLDSNQQLGAGFLVDRRARELQERQTLRPAATFAVGAGNREIPEAPDDVRTCFERDRDRIVTPPPSPARRHPVVVHPTDHQRTQLTHASRSQVATAIARGQAERHAPGDRGGHDCARARWPREEGRPRCFHPRGFKTGP